MVSKSIMRSHCAASYFVPVVVVIVFAIGPTHQVSLEQDLSLTYSQKLTLDKFKAIVADRLPHDYMKQDIYLIRWLRARNFDLKQAEIMLMENLQWREEAKMDTIIYEDWSDYEERFPYSLQGCDKEGRPVAGINVGEWDIRGAVLIGQRDRVIRYMDKLIEQINELVRIGQAQGANITQYTLIFDMGNYNLVEQGCAQCIPAYLAMFNSYENHYPGAVHKMFLVNTPPIFQALLTLIRPLLSPLTRDALYIYGTNKSQWKRDILKEIDPSQLSKTYGGVKEAGYEPEDVRKYRLALCPAHNIHNITIPSQ